MSSFARNVGFLPALFVLFAVCALIPPDVEDRSRQDRLRKDRYGQDQPVRYDAFRQGEDGHDPDSLRGNAGDDGRGGVPDDAPVFLGADLSYINEMEDCGGVYRETDR